MVHRVTLGVCGLAAVGTLAVGFAGCDWSLIAPEDLLVLPLAAGPYVLLALLAWWRRRRRAASAVVLVATLLLTVGGLVAFAADAYRLQTDPMYGMAMRLTVLVIPILQWLAAGLLGLALLAAWAWGKVRARVPRAKRRRSGTDAPTGG